MSNRRAPWSSCIVPLPMGRRSRNPSPSAWLHRSNSCVLPAHEGIDERVHGLCDETLSIGDFRASSGGEYAALPGDRRRARLQAGMLGMMPLARTKVSPTGSPRARRNHAPGGVRRCGCAADLALGRSRKNRPLSFGSNRPALSSAGQNLAASASR